MLVVTACTWSAFLFVDTWPARVAIGILAGYIGVQASAIAHEAGHGAVTRDARWSWFIGRFFMTFLIGASYGAWVERHGAHHLHPNSRKDPDVRPWLFSFNEIDAVAARGLAGWCTRHQHLLLIPLSTLMGFSLKLVGWRRVVCAPSAMRIDLLLLLHASIWIALPSFWIGVGNAVLNYGTVFTLAELKFLAAVNVAAQLFWIGIYVMLFFADPILGLCVVLVPHLATAIISAVIVFVQHGDTGDQLFNNSRTHSSPWATLLMAGTNYHLEHHLYPRVACWRLPRVHRWLKTTEWARKNPLLVARRFFAGFALVSGNRPYGNEATPGGSET